MPAGPLTHFIASALFYWGKIVPYVPTYTYLISTALLPIVTGAFASLKQPANAVRPPQEHENFDSSDIKQEEEPSRMENLKASDALWFPVCAGVCLGSLYLIIVFLDDPTLINKILTFYFSMIGVFAVARGFSDSLSVLVTYVFPRRYRSKKDGRLYVARYNSYMVKGEEKIRNENPLGLVLPKFMWKSVWSLRRALSAKYTLLAGRVERPVVKVVFWAGDLAGLVFGALAVGGYALGGKHWLLTNVMGTSFAYGAMQLLSPTTFTTASLLLGALFFYDIFFVFYTPMMVTVATTLDVPIKLLFPRPGSSPSGAQAMSMLGLGDVVIPGLVIAMALRYDLWRFYEKKRLSNLSKAEKDQSEIVDCDGHDLKRRKKDLIEKTKSAYVKVTGNWGERYWTGNEDGAEFSKFYFYMSLGGYFSGILTTLIVMHVFNHAQPALLYLVPGVLGGVWLGALAQGEIRTMWNYTEEGEEENSDSSLAASSVSCQDRNEKENRADEGSTAKQLEEETLKEETSAGLVEIVQEEEWRIAVTKRSITLQAFTKPATPSEDESEISSTQLSAFTASSISEHE